MPPPDVYRDWLGITDADRPLNYYQLLRLGKFEDDAGKVRANYRKMNAHVRKYAAGEYGARSQELLNELAKAMLCLTDSRRKSEYDASLGRTSTAGPRRTLEEILISRKIVDSAQLAKARNYARAVGVEMHDALVQQKLAKAEAVLEAFADSIGFTYVDLADIGVDESLAPQVPAVLARQHSCVPVRMVDGQLLMASPNPLMPEAEDELRLRMNVTVRSVICTAAQVNEMINKHYPKEAAVAQMAAARAGGPSAAGGATATGAVAASASQPASANKADSAPSDPEAKKRQRMVGLMAFNFTFLVVVGAQMVLRRVPVPMFSLANLIALGIGFAVGAVVGGIAFTVAKGR